MCFVRHRVAGWSIKPSPNKKTVHYDFTFKRLPTETDMQIVLTRPSAEEADDYQEYKRLRQLAREQQVKPAKNTPSPGTLRNLDMADGVYEDETI